ncbi:MAG: heavy-metal-associated domain-containing protein [Chloroflexi bacterium]|nr:heavy-metal-associated domain-containing protein [Chloroflexota bacterium]
MIADSSHDLSGEGKSNNAAGLIEQSLTVNGMTCGACVMHVELALRGVTGVVEADVSLARGKAKVRYDPSATTFATLRDAVEAVGYDLREDGASDQNNSTRASVHAFPVGAIVRPAVIGFLAAALLASLYVMIVGITQDFAHAFDLMTTDWYFVIPIVVGFGVQIGLFAYVRGVMKLRKGARSAKAFAGAGTGTSTVSMIACCAHHLTDVLPVLGLSGAAVFLNDNRDPFMAVGIATNLLGIAVMVRLIRKVHSHAHPEYNSNSQAC